MKAFLCFVFLYSLFSFNFLEINYNKTHYLTNIEDSNKLFDLLIPLTTKKHLIPCSKVFNEEIEFDKSLSCSNKKIFSKKPYNKELKDIKVPTCYVISSDSPDVNEYEDHNSIDITLIIPHRIVGFYQELNDTIYIVENVDDEMVYRHELQHYFLKLTDGDGNGKHDHKIWNECEPPYYTPSAEAKAAAIIKSLHK